MKIPQRKKSVLSVAQEKTLPPAPGTVAAAIFQEMAAAGSPTPTGEIVSRRITAKN